MLINVVVVKNVTFKLKVIGMVGETLPYWQLFMSWLHTTVVDSLDRTSQTEWKSFLTTLKELLVSLRYWNPLLNVESYFPPQNQVVSWKFIAGQMTRNISPVTCCWNVLWKFEDTTCPQPVGAENLKTGITVYCRDVTRKKIRIFMASVWTTGKLPDTPKVRMNRRSVQRLVTTRPKLLR